MTNSAIINQLAENAKVFEALLSGVSQPMYTWTSEKEPWSLLIVVGHLHDEEVEDFRTRTKHVLTNPETAPPPIHPQKWVEERAYANRSYETYLNKFLTERKVSIEWLSNLENPKWDNVWLHKTEGPLSAEFFLQNWLAHDFLHIRQINRIKYEYFAATSKAKLDYAGNW